MKARLTVRVLLPSGHILMQGAEYNIVSGSVTGPEEGKHPGYCEIIANGKLERVYYPEFEFTEGVLELGGSRLSQEATSILPGPSAEGVMEIEIKKHRLSDEGLSLRPGVIHDFSAGYYFGDQGRSILQHTSEQGPVRGKGGIGLMVHLYRQPTYLLQEKEFVYFVSFASQVWADKWFENEDNQGYERLWSFEPEEKE